MKEKLEKQFKKQIQAYESRKEIGINSEENLQSLFLGMEYIFNPVKSEGRRDD